MLKIEDNLQNYKFNHALKCGCIF